MLKKILKKYDWLLLVASCIYNLPLKFFVLRKVQMNIRGAFIKHCKFKIRGKNNVIVIGEKGRLRNCTIYISGNNNLLRIGGGHTIIANTTFWLQGDHCTIDIGEDFTMEGGGISVTENGKICIGKDCMFSFGIDIRNGDSHSILDLQGKRINKAKDICYKGSRVVRSKCHCTKRGSYRVAFNYRNTKCREQILSNRSEYLCRCSCPIHQIWN